MARQQTLLSISIIWRGKKFVVELNSEASLLELGKELKNLTDVKADTMRLIVPESSRNSSRLLMPFSDDHSSIKLQDTGIIEGKPLRMMGVLENEVDQLLQDAKANLRIAGFEEEEKRLKERISRRPSQSVKLHQGPYIFSDFRALDLPGIKLNPPPSEALKRMHMLAADPGIVAIMNKHRWRVGIMTEMAPVGYVGISPKCLLGLNKNHGEEISLRLRTDDLKGFRKYQVIKKTLLHELAHMVFSEHDENFHALDKQLNQEAFTLDWTRSQSHTLANTQFSGDDDFDMDIEVGSDLPQKLGGESSLMAASARAASVAAAYHRLADYSTNSVGPSSNQESHGNVAHDVEVLNSVGTVKREDLTNQHVGCSKQEELTSVTNYPDVIETVVLDSVCELNGSMADVQPHCDDNMRTVTDVDVEEEPDPDDSEVCDDGMSVDRTSVDSSSSLIENNTRILRTSVEPDPDNTEALIKAGDSVISETTIDGRGPLPDSPLKGIITSEPDPDDEELRRIQDPVMIFCSKFRKAMEVLENELNPTDVIAIQQTLFKIVRNISENPNEMKFRKLRKANPVFERSIAKHKAALEILFLVGFSEELVTDEIGRTETYLVLKRNDPGLLWLAKSSFETAFVE